MNLFLPLPFLPDTYLYPEGYFKLVDITTVVAIAQTTDLHTFTFSLS